MSTEGEVAHTAADTGAAYIVMLAIECMAALVAALEALTAAASPSPTLPAAGAVRNTLPGPLPHWPRHPGQIRGGDSPHLTASSASVWLGQIPKS